MNIKDNVPIVLYDNQCYLCTKFARFVNFFAKNKIAIIGHYSKLGEEIREQILDESALEMFWFIDKKRACGGRAALYPLVRSILLSKKRENTESVIIDSTCNQDCKTVTSVFVRSASLFTNSKKISYTHASKLNNTKN